MARTPEKIRDAALALFSSRCFETVSVAEVCREAGVSNGVFYRYHRGKEPLVRSLVEEFLSLFEAEVTGVRGGTLRERLLSLFTAVYAADAVFDPQRAQLRGVIVGPASRTAVIATHDRGAFFVKGARIFDVMGKTVSGFSATVREDRVVIVAETGETFELKLRQDLEEERAS